MCSLLCPLPTRPPPPLPSAARSIYLAPEIDGLVGNLMKMAEMAGRGGPQQEGRLDVLQAALFYAAPACLPVPGAVKACKAGIERHASSRLAHVRASG